MAEAAFLEALRANPADDTARLVYADWLDDRDQHEKAEYLRLVSRLAALGFGAPEAATLEAGLGELEAVLPADWTTAAGGAFEVAYLGLAYTWWPELAAILEHEVTPFGLREERGVLDRAAPAVLLDGMRAADARDTAARFNERLSGSVHAAAGRGEYYAMRRDQYVAQIESAGRFPFAAYPTGHPADTPTRRFDVVAVESSDWRSPHRHQNPDYLVPPLCSLLEARPEEATALMYSGEPFFVSTGLSFAAAVGELAELRKAFKRHHLGRPLTEAVLLTVRAGADGTADGGTDPSGGIDFS